MKQRLVQTISQGDNTYGQVSHPDDLMKAQEYVHQRVTGLLADFANNTKRQETSGFSYALDSGNAFSIEIKRPGRIHTKEGLSFDLLADTTLEFEPADETLPRLDLIVAVLDDEVAAEASLIPFVRLRTAEEFSESVPPYPPQNLNAPRELHWRAVPQIKTGTPAADAAKPTVASNEVALYLVAIAPGATQIREADILDMRDVALTIRRLNELTAEGKINTSNLQSRVARLEKLTDQPIDLSQVFGQIRTLGDILADLQKQIIASRDVPEIRYAFPKVPLTNIESSKIVATGNTDDDTPCVDIEVGGRVNFGDAEVVLLPHNFPSGTNARFATVGSDPGHLRREIDLTIDDVTRIDADGFVDFVERSSEFSAARGRPAAAARDDQFIEIYGGLAADNSSALGDWLTYDIENDTLTERTPSDPLPSSDRPALFPYGDGERVLFIGGSESNSTPQAFTIHAVTGDVTEITSTRPTGIQFFGDLIAPGKIFIVAIRQVLTEYETDFWEFDTATETFTELGVTGSIPTPVLDAAGGCHYGVNKFLMVTFDPAVSSSGKTFVFNRTSLQWVERTLPQPYGGSSADQYPLRRFRLANVNGRPLLVGGLLKKDVDASRAKIWELSQTFENGDKVLAWRPSDATFEPVQDPGFCSTLASSNLPTAKAFLFAGHGVYSDARKRVYSSQQGGLIAVSYDGSDGISIAESSTFVQFEIDAFLADWSVAAYLASIKGFYHSSDVKVEVSLDGGAHWAEVSPHGRTLEVEHSSSPALRKLRVTLYRNLTKMPILTHLTEALDNDGIELEDRLIVRYDAPETVKGLYVDRRGLVTLETDIVPSTSEKCLIHKVTPDGDDPPTVKNYINRRRAHFKKSGTFVGTIDDDTFDNDLAVPIRYVNTFGVADSGGGIYKVADPVINFDAWVLLAGVTVGDDWIVEIEA